MQSTIFGGNTGMSYEDIQRKRLIAEKLRATGGTPRSVGEGINAIGRALAARGMERRAGAADARNRSDAMESFNSALGGGKDSAALSEMVSNPYLNAAQQKIIQSLLSRQIPQYRTGTPYHPGGVAVVGEDGPELAYMPRGTMIAPNEATEDQSFMREFMDLPEEEKRRVLEQMQNGASPSDALQPEGYDPAMMFGPQSQLDDSQAYRTADMSGIQPSGVGEQSQLNAAARSYQGLMKSLGEYEAIFNDGGSTAWPGARRDRLSTAHRDLQMQMKELYNLGVLNGPDLDLMNQILLDPTSVSGNVMDALGVADMEKRIPANIADVRRMMQNRAEPALQQLGIDPQSLMPAQDASAPAATGEDGWQEINGVRIRVKR